MVVVVAIDIPFGDCSGYGKARALLSAFEFIGCGTFPCLLSLYKLTFLVRLEWGLDWEKEAAIVQRVSFVFLGVYVCDNGV